MRDEGSCQWRNSGRAVFQCSGAAFFLLILQLLHSENWFLNNDVCLSDDLSDMNSEQTHSVFLSDNHHTKNSKHKTKTKTKLEVELPFKWDYCFTHRHVKVGMKI